MEKRTQTGLVMGHAYGVTAVKKVYMYLCIVVLPGMLHAHVQSCTSKFLFLTDTLVINNLWTAFPVGTSSQFLCACD